MKKMNKKGFTLIELLAIIVILAIIAVITVPLILGIIDEARTKSAISSVVGYGKAVELAYSHDLLGTDPTLATTSTSGLSNGSYINLTIGETSKNLRVDFSGDQVVCGTDDDDNVVENGKIILTDCKIAGKANPTYVYDNGRACLSTDYDDGCPTS